MRLLVRRLCVARLVRGLRVARLLFVRRLCVPWLLLVRRLCVPRLLVGGPSV
jgi:hypothetical protein